MTSYRINEVFADTGRSLPLVFAAPPRFGLAQGHNLPMMQEDPSQSLADRIHVERLKLSSSLVVAEYSALRSEVQQAMDTAQGAVRWSMGTFGVLVAAGLLAANNALQQAPSNHWAGIAALILFGAALPGLVCAGAWTWLGELHRMERAGAHLRGIETRVGRIDGMRDLLGGQPVWQERFIVRARTKKSSVGKQSVAYFSTAVLFGGAAGTSMILFMAWHREMFHWSTGEAWGVTAWVSLMAAIAIFLTFFGVSLWLGVRLLGLSGSTSELGQGELEAHGGVTRRGKVIR